MFLELCVDFALEGIASSEGGDDLIGAGGIARTDMGVDVDAASAAALLRVADAYNVHIVCDRARRRRNGRLELVLLVLVKVLV